MYRIQIILMLPTIIPGLDCCSSRTLFQEKPIHFYRTVERSLQKSNQFPQNDPQEVLHSALPPQLSIGGDQTTLSYNRYIHFGYNNDEEKSDDEEENVRLNRLQISDLLDEQKLEDDITPGYVGDKDDADSEQMTIAHAFSDRSVDDAQYKFIGEIGNIECVEWYRLEFCLNGGRCFLYPILNQSLSSCECAEGYVGERCEAKSYEFIPQISPRFVLAKTIGGPIVFGLAVIDILFLLFLFCKKCNRD